MNGPWRQRSLGRTGRVLGWLLAFALALGQGFAPLPAASTLSSVALHALSDICAQSHGGDAPAKTSHDCCPSMCGPTLLAPPPAMAQVGTPHLSARGRSVFATAPVLYHSVPSAYRPRGPPDLSLLT
jgi:hypothetical protein